MQTTLTKSRTVPEQIAELRSICPSRVALEHGKRRIAYRDLNYRADQISNYLTGLGVGCGSRVVIWMERSCESIIAALGIMRAGATYIPLDPAWPDARAQVVIDDSSAVAVVAQAGRLIGLKMVSKSIDLRRDATMIARAVPCKPVPIQPEGVAYQIYTSGSTGSPKGVEITHANLFDLVSWHQAAFNVRQEDRVSHLAGIGFDAAVWEIWCSLCLGATLCIPDDPALGSGVHLQDWLVQKGITVCFAPTVLAEPLMAVNWPPETALRLLLTGGDVLQKGPRKGLPFDVINNYGPTECTVVATSVVLTPDSDEVPSIGRPRDGAIVYILDDNGRPVPENCCGEIYIGGRCVGRGYHKLAALTSQVFLPDPFCGEQGARMFRTGDRGFWMSTGEIRFMGRSDRQVKIRGQRIELDEIGAVLARHPGIDFAIAAIRGNASDDKKLLAFVLPRAGVAEFYASELQDHLRQSLPNCMIPGVFVRLSRRPLSPNGKLDIGALPEPNDDNVVKLLARGKEVTSLEAALLGSIQEKIGITKLDVRDNIFLAGVDSLISMQVVMLISTNYGIDLNLQQIFEAGTVERIAALIAACLETERRLGAIWESLLARSHVGPTDNFFECGGDAEILSLLQKCISKEFDRVIPSAALFQNHTIREQADLVQRDTQVHSKFPPGVLPIQKVIERKAVFWIHYLDVDLGLLVGHAYQWIFVTLTHEDIESLGSSPAFETVAGRFVAKILATQSSGPYVIGGGCLGGVLAYEIGIQLIAAGHEVSLLILADPPSPSYLTSRHPLTPTLRHPFYLLKRIIDIGFRRTLRKVHERVGRQIQSSLSESLSMQDVLEQSALVYSPHTYRGTVLLLLAAYRPPNIDFLPEWRALVPHRLKTAYVNGQHTEILRAPHVREVASIIASELDSSLHGEALSSAAGHSERGPFGSGVDIVNNYDTTTIVR